VQPLAPEQYKIQFTMSRDTHDKLRRVQADQPLPRRHLAGVNLRVGIVRMRPVVVRAFFFRVERGRRAVGVSMPEACASLVRYSW
jgi:hypothetical protein